ncbi:MAG TPA: hypothetical protein PKY50_13045 [Candidatus Competibacter sp.]|nr:hypothetical protein [Candidatus Competibacter sp.]
MLWLTDHPEITMAFPPAKGAWSPCSTSELAPTERELWDLLAGRADCWRRGATPSTRYPERLAILIDHAPSSQFEVLQRALRAGTALPDGLVCLALTGTRFRGQRQRSWMALRGNLHLAVHYRLDFPAASAEAPLIMLPAVAAAESIRRTSEGRCVPAIKWVNDLVLPAGKVAGVLTATQIESGRIASALFGIGINLERAPAIDPTPFVPRAAALVDTDPNLRGKLPELFAALVSALDEGIRSLEENGSDDVYRRYRAGSACIGREARLWPASCDDPDRVPPLAWGRIADILPDLSLLLDGCAEPIRNARLALLPPDVG